MKAASGGESRLCFLDASCVKSPAGDLGDLQLQSQTGESLGRLKGVLIDPAVRRVRYFVVRGPGWFRSRKYLISTDCLAKVERNSLRVDMQLDEVKHLDDFENRSIRNFSEEDAVEAMFARQVA